MGKDNNKAGVVETPATIEEAVAIIAKLEAENKELSAKNAELKASADEAQKAMIEQSIHVTSLEETIAKAQAEGKIDLTINFEGKTYKVLSGVNLDGEVYKKEDLAKNEEVIRKVLAIQGQGILKLEEEAE